VLEKKSPPGVGSGDAVERVIGRGEKHGLRVVGGRNEKRLANQGSEDGPTFREQQKCSGAVEHNTHSAAINYPHLFGGRPNTPESGLSQGGGGKPSWGKRRGVGGKKRVTAFVAFLSK